MAWIAPPESQKPGPRDVNSIPDDKYLGAQINAAARSTALELRLPWGLSKLREHGKLGAVKARTAYDWRLGLSPAQQQRMCIRKETLKGGESMRAWEAAEWGKSRPKRWPGSSTPR
jgi:hypothetical protein